MTNGIWLINLVNAVRPISKTYFIIYTKQANDTKKAYLLEYYKVAMELQEAFANLLKVILSLTTKGSVFNVDFIGKSKKDIFIAAEV